MDCGILAGKAGEMTRALAPAPDAAAGVKLRVFLGDFPVSRLNFQDSPGHLSWHVSSLQKKSVDLLKDLGLAPVLLLDRTIQIAMGVVNDEFPTERFCFSGPFTTTANPEETALWRNPLMKSSGRTRRSAPPNCRLLKDQPPYQRIVNRENCVLNRRDYG